MNLSAAYLHRSPRRSVLFSVTRFCIPVLLLLWLPPVLRAQTPEETFANGRPKAEGQWLNGQREGKWTEFYPTGAVAAEGNYNAGKKTGIWKEYYVNGVSKAETDYSKGRVKIFFENGNLRTQGSLKNGKKQGKWTEYHQNGKPKSVELDRKSVV